MKDIYILNQNLERIGLIDSYKSLIWADRYKSLGDCELYLSASKNNIKLLRKNNYLEIESEKMCCRIKKIELDTSNEDGNYLIVTAIDVKSLLYQRIVWETMSCTGNVENFIRNIINKNMCSQASIERQFLKLNGTKLFDLGDSSNFTEKMTDQVTYQNIGEKIEEYCQTYGWGSRVVLNNGCFYFQLYKGVDRSNNIIFSDNYENLHSTKYINDDTNLGNYALIAGQGEGSERTKGLIGNVSNIDRYEVYIDARDLSKNITYKELRNTYPNGTLITTSSGYSYQMSSIDIQIIDDNQLEDLINTYPNGEEITIDGYDYYRISNVIIADIEKTDNSSVDDGDTVVLRDLIYSVYLLNRGVEKLSEYGSVESFEGTVEPYSTFEYEKDYFLGDLVTVENEFGISLVARITEVVKVYDENGYSIEPKFEYLN